MKKSALILLSLFFYSFLIQAWSNPEISLEILAESIESGEVRISKDFENCSRKRAHAAQTLSNSNHEWFENDLIQAKASGNAFQSNNSCSGVEVTFELTTDCWPEETGFTLVDDNNNIIDQVISGDLSGLVSTTITYKK